MTALRSALVISIRGTPDAIDIAGQLQDCATMIEHHAWDIPRSPRPQDERAALGMAEAAARRAIEIIQERRAALT